MKFKFWPTGKTKQETPEQVNEIVEPIFNVLTNLIPGRYPRAVILDVALWAGMLNPEKGMLKLKVQVNEDLPETPQTGYIYLNPISYGILLQAMGIDRTDLFEVLIGRRLAVESREKVYMDRSGYELVICGPKIVWGSKG
jgi:hypothetical protein